MSVTLKSCILAFTLAAWLPGPEWARSEEFFPEGHDDNVYALAFDGTGDFCVSASGDGRAIFWDVQQRKLLHLLKHDAPVYDARILGDSTVVTVTGDGRVSWWRGGQPTAFQKVHGHAVYALACTADGLTIASAGGDTDGGDTAIRVWDASNRTVREQMAGHQRPVYGLAFSADGTQIVSASSDTSVRIWRLGANDCLTLHGHRNDVYRCEFDGQGRRLATCGQDGTIRIWDALTGAETAAWTVSRDPVYALDFAPDGQFIASAADDGQLRIHSCADGNVVQSQQLSREALYAVQWLPDQKSLLVGGADGKIRIVQKLPQD